MMPAAAAASRRLPALPLSLLLARATLSRDCQRARCPRLNLCGAPLSHATTSGYALPILSLTRRSLGTRCRSCRHTLSARQSSCGVLRCVAVQRVVLLELLLLLLLRLLVCAREREREDADASGGGGAPGGPRESLCARTRAHARAHETTTTKTTTTRSPPSPLTGCAACRRAPRRPRRRRCRAA